MVIRRIRPATGGGDCPGLNAAIRSRGKNRDPMSRLARVTNGFDGLIWPERCVEMTVDSVRGLLPLGGTILGTTNRGNPFRYPVKENGLEEKRDFSERCLKNFKSLDLDALVVVGGEGTWHRPRFLAARNAHRRLAEDDRPRCVRDGNHHWI